MRKFIFFALVMVQLHLNAQPVINSFSPVSGPIGTTVTISGSGFSSNPNNNVVFLGAARALVSSASGTSVTVTVPVGASYRPISITSGGLTGYSSTPFNITFPGGGAITKSSFATRVDFNYNTAIVCMGIKDMDNDGKPDVYSGCYGTTGGPLILKVAVARNTSTPGNFSIATPIEIASPNISYYITSEDMDGDGKPDIVAPTYNSTVSIFKNASTAGNISFGQAQNISTNGGFGIAVADFDGDGKPDFASSSKDYNIVSVHRNTSFGGILSFAPFIDLTTANSPRQVAIGYINEDNKPDILVADQYSQSFSVFINTSSPGNISFNSKIDFPTTTVSNPEGIAVGDFDGDGKQDVAVSNNNYNDTGTVSVFRNISVGNSVNFETKLDLRTDVADYPFAISITDMDGNGKPDIVVANQFDESVSIFRNASEQGSLSFTKQVKIPLAEFASWGMTVADMDLDGKPDICATYRTNNQLSLIRNIIEVPNLVSFSPLSACADSAVTIKGTNFTGASSVSFGGLQAASFTVLSDTVIKAVPGAGVTGSIAIVNAYGTGSIDGFTNTGTCALPPVISSFSPASGPAGTVVTIKGQHFSNITSNNIVYVGAVKASVLTATDTLLTIKIPKGASGNSITVTANSLTGYAQGSFNITFNGGNTCDAMTDKSFAGKIDFATGGSPYATSILSMDVDSKADIAVADFSSNTISLFANNSQGSSVDFTSAAGKSTGLQPADIVYGDFDGDGKLDMATANYNSSTVSVFKNLATTNSVSYAVAETFPSGSNPRSIVISDVDLDGRPDIILSNLNSSSISVLRNTSGGIGLISFANGVSFAVGAGPVGLFAVDINQDRLPEIIVVNSQANTVSVLKNTSNGSGDIAFGEKIDLNTGSQPLAVFLQDINADGKADILVANAAGNSISVFKNTVTNNVIAFAAKVDFPSGAGPISINVSDVNGDDLPDVCVANFYDASVSVLINKSLNGAVSFAAKLDYPTGSNPQGINIADINGDNKPDIIVANNGDNTVSVLRSNIGFAEGETCAGASITLLCEQAGASYQWQVDNGSGFTNISENATYSGTQTPSLHITAASSSLYGYKYRCIAGSNIGQPVQLAFVNYFTGAVDGSWENLQNWSCNKIPDANTDVIISCAKAVTVSSNAVCRSIVSKLKASVVVKTGYSLTLSH